MEKNLQVQNQNTNLKVASLSAPQQLMVNIAENYIQLFDNKVYDKDNAIKLALEFANELSNVRTKTGEPAYQVCSPESVKETFFKVLDNNIDLGKKQGALICYGNKLTLQLEYFGNIKLAKDNVPNLVDIRGVVVYKGDTLKVDVKDGMYVIQEHLTKFENMSDANIIGAYSIAIYKDANGNERKGETEIMNIVELQNAWKQSKNGTMVHSKFGHEMARKTVESRNAKHLLNKLATFTYDNEETYNDNDVIDVKPYVEETPVIQTPKVYAQPKVEETKIENVSTQEVESNTKQVEEPFQAVNDIFGSTNVEKQVEEEPITSVPDFNDMFNNHNFNNNRNNFSSPNTNTQVSQQPIQQQEINNGSQEELVVPYKDYLNQYKPTGQYKTLGYDATTKTIRIVKIN